MRRRKSKGLISLASAALLVMAMAGCGTDSDGGDDEAQHANAMAHRLWDALARLPGVEAMAPVESNAVFARLPPGTADRLWRKGWRFYPWGDGFRLMCAWDTAPETVDRFAADVAEGS